jgi:hypothetical protein
MQGLAIMSVTVILCHIMPSNIVFSVNTMINGGAPGDLEMN